MRHTRTCECGAEMKIDGYDIPWETYLSYAQRLNAKDVPKTYKDLLDVLTKKHFQFSLLGVGQICHLLGQATGISPDDIDLNDCEVKNKLLGGDFSCVSPKLAEFLKQAYTVAQPCSYADLLKLIGMAHGTLTWRNAEELLLSGECKLSDIPAIRDDVFMMIRDVLQERGVYDTGFAFDVSEKARRGYYAEHRMDGYTIETLKNLGFDDWFASYLLGTRYLSTRALSVLELRYIILLSYFKTYYPKVFEKTLAGEDICENNA